jgi:membrane protease YdiL (CAAX protease family)
MPEPDNEPADNLASDVQTGKSRFRLMLSRDSESQTKKNQLSAAVRMPVGIPGLPEPPRQIWRSLAGILLLVHTLLSIILLVARLSWPAFSRLVSGPSARAYVTGGLLMQGGLIFLPTIILLFWRNPPTVDIMGGKARAGSLILSVTAGIPAAVVFQGLNNLLIYVLVKTGISLPEPTSALLLSGLDLLNQPWPTLALILLVGIILPGIMEELFFRGVLQASLSSGGATGAALFWQAVAFSLFHADALYLLPPFLAGLLLGFIRLRCGSLWPAMLTHMSLNLSLIALTPLLPRLTGQYLFAGTQQAASLLYASLIAACVAAVALVPLLVLIGNLHHPARHSHEHPTSRLVLFPGDWKFALAIILQIATIILFIK